MSQITPEEALDPLADCSAELRGALQAHGRAVEAPAGSRVFSPGQTPQAFLLVLSGVVRVQQISEGGREIVLYRVSAGQSCALTTACLLGNDFYTAEGVAETDVRALAVPSATFDRLVSESQAFRTLVFNAFSRRVSDLFRLIDEVAFQRVDIRLAQKILALAKDADTLAITHQQLAAELGTAREVVSRAASEFQRRGWLSLARGRLVLKDRAALARLAADGASADVRPVLA